MGKIVYLNGVQIPWSAWIARHGENRSEFARFKERARVLVHERIKHFNDTFYHFPFNRVSIKNQKGLWGSCSIKGNLNFHYKIIRLPSHLADYLIVHELCHLWKMDHSKEFWGLVARALPNWKEARRELKKMSPYYF